MISYRENILYGQLGKKLMAAGKQKLFDTWMLQESDLVQAAARAFGNLTIFLLPWKHYEIF